MLDRQSYNNNLGVETVVGGTTLHDSTQDDKDVIIAKLRQQNI
jgi:hypothetical protein